MQALKNKKEGLVMVDFRETLIGDNALLDFAENLQHCPSLSWLEFEDCNIRNHGVSFLMEALESNTGIWNLNLARNFFGFEGHIPSSMLLEEFTRCPFETFLADGLDRIRHTLQLNKNIAYLNLSENFLSDEGIRVLVKNSSLSESGLTRLDLCSNLISRDGAKELASLLEYNPGLVGLFLKGNKLSDDGCLELARGLQKNNTLTWLDLSCNNIFDKGVGHIAAALESLGSCCVLGSIDLSGNEIEADLQLAKAIETCPSIFNLNLERNNLNRHSAEYLARACSRHLLSEGGDGITAISILM